MTIATAFEPDVPLFPPALLAAKICLLQGLLGILTNLFVFWALTKTKNWFSATNVLFFNLFISDTIYSVWNVVLNFAHSVNGRRWITFEVCQFGGVLTQALVGVSFATVLLQTLNPFAVIVLEWPSLTGKQMFFLIFGLWTLTAGLMGTLTFIGGDYYIPQSSYVWCHLNYASDSLWTRIIIMMNILLLSSSPLAMIGAYTMMWIKMRRRAYQSKSNRAQWNIVRNGAYFIVTTIAFWLIPVRGMIIQFANQSLMSEMEDVVSLLIGTLPNIANSLIFVAVNAEVRQTIFRIFDPDYKAARVELEEDVMSRPSMISITESSSEMKMHSSPSESRTRSSIIEARTRVSTTESLNSRPLKFDQIAFTS